MGKTVFSSLLVFVFICANLGATVHAEEIRKPGKVIIDGVEYVPKEKEKKISSVEKENEKRVSQKSESPFAKFFEGTKNGDLENFEMKGKKAVGLEVSLVNLGIGPTAEYWFTDNIAVLAHYSGLMDFQTIGVRGEYLFDKPFKIYNYYNTKPYVGIGYSQVKYTGGLFEAEGSGADFHAGILTSAQQVTEGLMMRLEVGYSTTELEMTTDFGFGETKTPVSGWSGFGIAYGAYYYF